jgi:putative NADH-flavin reductase
MSRLIIAGATGHLGRHVLHQALASGHQVTVLVRSPSKLPVEAVSKVSIHSGDLGVMASAELARIISGHDVLINCAGHVTEGRSFVDLVDRIVASVESLPGPQPVCWFLTGAALLDIDPSGRRGIDLPRVKSIYWPHRVNFERLSRSSLDWRLLCPGPMVEQSALGLKRLPISLDRLPVEVPAVARVLPDLLLLPVFASLIPQMIVPYADAAELILTNLYRGNSMAGHRVGIALPPGTRVRKSQWSANRRDAA